jgi:hypothetical protein
MAYVPPQGPKNSQWTEQTVRRLPSLLTAKPIRPVQIQTTATTIYTAVADADFWIVHLWAANVTAGSTEYTLYFVPSGGAAATSNTVVFQRTLPAKTSEIIDVAINHRISEGDFIQAICTTNNDVNIGGWGYDQTGEP